MMILPIAVAILCLFMFVPFAFAQEEVLFDLAKPVYEAALGGQWALAAASALILGVAVVRKFGDEWSWVNKDWGASLLVLLGSFGGAAATALAGGATISFALVWEALQVAVAASGGYSLIKKLLVEPLLRPWANKAPKWLKPFLNMILWLFDGSSEAAKARAKAAGDKAVAEKPSSGISGVIGTPKNLE